MTSTELQTAAVTLASQAYHEGIEIGNSQDLSDPFSPIAEPKTSPSSAVGQSTPWQALPEEFSLPPPSTDYEDTFLMPDQQITPDLESFALQNPAISHLDFAAGHFPYSGAFSI
jgi:hypothetical protein